MEELKPCPFCGGKASVIDHHNDDGSVSVGCADDTCLGFSGLGWLYKTEAEAIAAWNTRAACDDCQMGGVPATEENMARYGWVKERTCRIETRVIDGIEEDFCSACGNEVARYYRPHYCPACGARVVSEEEQGHMVADAIRRLEKAVEK